MSIPFCLPEPDDKGNYWLCRTSKGGTDFNGPAIFRRKGNARSSFVTPYMASLGDQGGVVWYQGRIMEFPSAQYALNYLLELQVRKDVR